MSIYNTDAPFYFKSIRNITAAFGTLFNEILIVRKDSNDTEVSRHLVPLVYASRHSWYSRLQSRVGDFDANGAEINLGKLLPAMSFSMLGMQYAASRKLNTMNVMAARDVDFTTNTKTKSFAPAPYDFTFEVNAYTKNIEDGLQIVEQIAPFFQPSVTIKIKEMLDPLIYNDIKVSLTGITSDDNAAQQWELDRLIQWTFSFEVTGNIYPPFNPTKIIREAIVDVNDLDTDTLLDQYTESSYEIFNDIFSREFQ